jgi:hypothetical protein
MGTFSRRSFLAGSIAGLAASASSILFGQNTLTHELQRGDPALHYEQLDYRKSHVDQLSSGGKGTLEKPVPHFGEQVVSEAKENYVGKNRQNARDLIDSFLTMFGSSFENHGKPVPFCAAGLSWVATTVYANQAGISDRKDRLLQPYLLEVRQRHFYPTPSVANMKTVAEIEGKWVARTPATGVNVPRTGWLVVYSWEGKRPDHVGIIDSVEPGYLNTVEFNTSDKDDRDGGAIAMRRREINQTVLGYIRI